MPAPAFLGVDVGSRSVSAALLGGDGLLLRTEHRAHEGHIHEALRGLMDGFGAILLKGIGATSASPKVMSGATSFDSQLCLLEAGRRMVPGVRSILYAGGERFGLLRLDSSGAYLGSRSNSSCAAGTGSFLDQQARRLGLRGAQELCRRARASTGPPPKISTRCAVFARTDLIHAQQAGHSLEAICDGVCAGVARNLADTLGSAEPLQEPALFVGGVSRNDAVRHHLETILALPLTTHPHGAAFGAIGAAFCRMAVTPREILLDPDSLLGPQEGGRTYVHAPLPSDGCAEPGSGASEGFTLRQGPYAARHPVEVEVYRRPPASEVWVWAGIDVGSTSTKAMLIDARLEPLAGFYTRTLGAPVTAVQALAQAMEQLQESRGARFRFRGVGTTGSGRRLIGAILRADLVVDEITAHARAACQLDPAVDTIIEIGGQDAKFTTLRNGVVTFCHMNTVCAAGTGSFLEEQAARLGCQLSDYARQVGGARAPLASDRCAVFMERDINTLLTQGYTREEALAAALFSVRENYLSKVARGAAIGNRITFQGATARNTALVEAFRRGLGKDILVSRYCHLTGAYGAALLLGARNGTPSGFVGLEALRRTIPVRTERCPLCTNHCRLSVASVEGREAATGFLCGRDYGTSRRIDRNTSGFDLAGERSRSFAEMERATRPPLPPSPTIGLPAALGLYGYLPLWKRLFALLGIAVVTSEELEDSVALGRRVQGAEFCAPVAAFHGHVAYLAHRADSLFLPVLLEEPRPGSSQPRMQCYYTQYSSTLSAGALGGSLRARCLMPPVSMEDEGPRTPREIHRSLAAAGWTGISLAAVRGAFHRAQREYREAILRLQIRMREATAGDPGPHVVLLGRPYTVLSPEMGKGIPGILASLGIKAFFQDMVSCRPQTVRRIRPLLDQVHWVNAARVLEAACVVADTPGLYPVYVTSFKCSPDSITLEYFRRILDAKGKPYLVLQLDDHDSTLGCETRIEAAVQSFRNHARAERLAPDHPQSLALPVLPKAVRRVGGRTLLVPNWDPLVNPLLAANLRREGIDARLLHEDASEIRRGMRMNTGQCLPLSIIAQETVDFVRSGGLDPGRTALWMPTVLWSCNLGMFTPFLKALLEAEGGGMEKVSLYAGDFYYREIGLRAVWNAYRAYLLGGLLRRAGCRLRPYEEEQGATDRAIAGALQILLPAFEGRTRMGDAVEATVACLEGIRVSGVRKPKVAIFGDFYVRDNDVMNQGLVHALEDAGAEVVVTPYVLYVQIVIASVLKRMVGEGKPMAAAASGLLWAAVRSAGWRLRQRFARLVQEPLVSHEREEDFLRGFGVSLRHGGESFDNLLKIRYLARTVPDLSLVVQASPAFCCPSLVTEAMGTDIARAVGVPVVSLTYDGTGASMNEAVIPYLADRGSRRPPPAA